MANRNKIVKRTIWLFVLIFSLMNVVAMFHAYKFTHFSSENISKTNSPEKLGTFATIEALLLGVGNPRPSNQEIPNNYRAINLHSNKKIECWYKVASTDTVCGTVILFHGYSGTKTAMLDKAAVFDSLNYNVLLVDFMGSGGSEGNQTTIGFKEAEEVKTAFEYIQNRGANNIYLFGSSMGAVAIMKAINDYNLQPKGIILECPFGSIYKTTCARFNTMNVPSFPMAGLLVFWGGVENGFWAFSHNPTEYAKLIKSPTLLLYGEEDKNVSQEETAEIFENLNGAKTLKIYSLAGHENYLIKHRVEWHQDISEFLNTGGHLAEKNRNNR